MDPITLAIILGGCAAVAVAGAVGTRAARRHANPSPPAPPAPPAPRDPPVPAEADPFTGLPVRLGDVVQLGDVTRWPRAALLLQQGGELAVAVLIAREHGQEQAVVCFPPPRRELWWLSRVELDLPPSPPGRVEIGTHLLDRTRLFPADVSGVGDGAPALADSAMVALYEGALGDAAIVLGDGHRTLAYHGERVDPGDYDVLGQVDPEHMNE